MPTPQNYRIGALTFYGVAVAPLGHLSTGEAFIGRDAAPITWGVGRPPWGAPTVIVGSKFNPGVLPQKWGAVDFMKCSHNELVDVIARWDGWVDPRWLGNAAAAPAAQFPLVAPTYSLDHVKWGSTPPSKARPMSPWPHTCDKCGAPALQMFTSIECSKSCAPDRRAR